MLRAWLDLVRDEGGSGALAQSGLTRLLPIICDGVGAAGARWVAQRGPAWVSLGFHGEATPLDSPAVLEKVAMCLDQAAPSFGDVDVALPIGTSEPLTMPGPGRETPTPQHGHEKSSHRINNAVRELAAVPLAPRVLLIRWQQPPTAAEQAVATALRDPLAAMVDMDFRWRNSRLALDQLRTLLNHSIAWSSIEDTDELLEAIAEAATQMLRAERASIFLWDKRRGKLVGRPALGVENGVLEVADNAGIVGSVLATGEPQIWTAGADRESEVNRSVDQKLNFKTRSIVAVPMRSPSGQPLGVFEVLNKSDLAGADDSHTGKKQAGVVVAFDRFDVARLTDLASHAAAAIQGTQTRQRLTQARDRLLHDAASTYQVIGKSPAIGSLRDSIQRVAPTDLAVLVLGENGTGKEVVARSLHFQSHRRDQPFVAVNCAALVESLLESELFGHERGAFTDAHQARPGKFELASGGTLFLDEIGDMSPGGQAKLLRVLEEKIVVRVGGSLPIPVDVRIIAATNQSLPDLVAARKFREDLFFRLNVVSFRLPALRQRGDDILILAEHFLEQFAAQSGRKKPRFSAEAAAAMKRHPWRGNVRELRNVMERVIYLASSDTLSVEDLGLVAFDTRGTSSPAPIPMNSDLSTLSDATRAFQIAHIESTIQTQRGNMTAAAELLGLHRSNLYRKMRQLGMHVVSELDP